MDELQLRMTVPRVTAMANAIERDLQLNRVGPEAAELTSILAWLRYRLARIAAPTPDNPAL